MDLLICILLDTIFMVWCIFACNLCVHRNKKISLCHFVLWQPMTCECSPKDLCEFFNFKFLSNFALVHVNIASLQIQILLREAIKIWNIKNKHNFYLDMQLYLYINILYCIVHCFHPIITALTSWNFHWFFWSTI
jgi:hypothetical protein